MASRLLVCFLALAAFTACSGTRQKRLQERDKLAASSGLYCDFVNGDEYQDMEVELNMQMSRRCDSNRVFTVTGYKNSSDIHGLVYCCALPRKDEPVMALKHAGTVAKPMSEEERRKLEASKSEAKPEAKAPVAKPEAPKPETPPVTAPAKIEAKAGPDGASAGIEFPGVEVPSAPSAPGAPAASPAPSAPAKPEAKIPEAARRQAPAKRLPASQKPDPSDLDAILEN